MNLTPLNVPLLLRKHNLSPRKSLGQNFLVDTAALEKVIKAADLKENDHVLEIGAGLGSLTRLLAIKVHHVTAVEIDQNLIPILQDVLKPHNNVTIIHGDIMNLDLESFLKVPEYIVVANIPYYITSGILRHLLESSIKPSRLVLTVQKEVASRIQARDGKMSLLSLSVQVFGEVHIAAVIPAGCFYPVPNIDSSVIVIDLFDTPVVSVDLLDDFFKLIHAGFSQKRKMLRNTLTSGLPIEAEAVMSLLDKAKIDPKRRAETLAMEEWKALTIAYANLSK